MRKNRIQIVYRNCPRCNKVVAGTNRSIYGADAAHAKYSGLCERCATEEEKKDILSAQASAILKRDL